jgi:hypothetical protein
VRPTLTPAGLDMDAIGSAVRITAHPVHIFLRGQQQTVDTGRELEGQLSNRPHEQTMTRLHVAGNVSVRCVPHPAWLTEIHSSTKNNDVFPRSRKALRSTRDPLSYHKLPLRSSALHLFCLIFDQTRSEPWRLRRGIAVMNEHSANKL